jgi:aminopeptidase N
VYRDIRFTSDQSDAAVKRIFDVKTVRQMQMPEDAGPLAHPIRPEEYVKMDNFYTRTVYRKGAEVRYTHIHMDRQTASQPQRRVMSSDLK